jgi:nitrate reductase assembly molybdenum cofactor insertion protein NarJ/NAD-dependent dihydropyrimidine dehydrogenase PreA subunit
MNKLAARSRLYWALAEALAEPDDEFCRAGCQWPLFEAAVEVADGDPLIAQAVVELADIPPESLSRRRARYEALFGGDGRPQLCLYESLAREGRLVGACSMALWATYQAAGLTVAGAELPDHASVELAFLAYLIEQQISSAHESAQWRRARRLFIQRHAGQWLPALGDALAQTGDRVYKPVGCLLAASIRREMQPRRHTSSGAAHRLPSMPQPELCSLCSFCVQVCPTRALAVQETDEATRLLLNAANCVSCGHCLQICPSHALQFESSPADGSRSVLRQSPRACCPACGQPTISEAELEEVAARIGAPSWLNYCLNCRSQLLERTL